MSTTTKAYTASAKRMADGKFYVEVFDVEGRPIGSGIVEAEFRAGDAGRALPELVTRALSEGVEALGYAAGEWQTLGSGAEYAAPVWPAGAAWEARATSTDGRTYALTLRDLRPGGGYGTAVRTASATVPEFIPDGYAPEFAQSALDDAVESLGFHRAGEVREDEDGGRVWSVYAVPALEAPAWAEYVDVSPARWDREEDGALVLHHDRRIGHVGDAGGVRYGLEVGLYREDKVSAGRLEVGEVVVSIVSGNDATRISTAGTDAESLAGLILAAATEARILGERWSAPEGGPLREVSGT